MKIFDYPYHTISDEYPESSTIVQFGKGYTFASKPKAPDQMIFHLEMKGFCWWATQMGVIDRTSFAHRNAGHIQDFYEAHRLYEPFLYNHPTRGELTVRFRKALPPFKSIPLAVEEMLAFGLRGHCIEPFTVDLILIP